MSQQLAATAAHFTSWPEGKPIVTDAKASDLASLLLLVSLQNRNIHITDVRNREDVLLISLSKSKGLKVTCDISAYALFFHRGEFPGSRSLPTQEDQQAFWDNIDIFDAVSVGTLPKELASELGKEYSPSSGMEEMLPLLLMAVKDGKLTLDWIKERLYENPVKIFNLTDISQSQVEIVVDRKAIFALRKTCWSPLQSKQVTGGVHRVMAMGQTVFLDGAVFNLPQGNDLSNVVTLPPRSSRLSVSGSRPSITDTPSSSTLPLPTSPPPRNATMPSAFHQSAVPLAASQAMIIPTSNIQPSIPRPFTFPPAHPSFHRRHILSVKQFTHQDLHDLFNLAHEMRLQVERSGTLDILKGKVLCTLFYEPSTRTQSSFDAAMKRCGGEVVQVAAETSSVQKGESLSDTIRTLGCYADAIVIRHPDVGSAQTAAKFSPVPILNAGDGIGEHPTQALLDVYTIRSELGTVNGKTITLLGDLKNGRTVHSLVTLLSLYSVRLNFVSPASLSMPASVVSFAKRARLQVHQCESLEEVLAQTDVLYVTRVQKERFESEEEWARVKDSYRVDHALLSRAKPDMIIMHPLPRLAEIDPEVDFDSRRAVYFRQMRYGLFIRMALLASVMG